MVFVFGLCNVNPSARKTVAALWVHKVLWLVLSVEALAVCISYTHKERGRE